MERTTRMLCCLAERGVGFPLSEDKELELLKHRRMLELMKRLQKEKAKAEKKEERDPKKILSKILRGRAWEVLRAAEIQYPEATRRVEEGLAQLVSQGKLKGPIQGVQLLRLFRSLGMNVKLETRIRILENGKLKTIEERLKGE